MSNPQDNQVNSKKSLTQRLVYAFFRNPNATEEANGQNQNAAFSHARRARRRLLNNHIASIRSVRPDNNANENIRPDNNANENNRIEKVRNYIRSSFANTYTYGPLANIGEYKAEGHNLGLGKTITSIDEFTVYILKRDIKATRKNQTLDLAILLSFLGFYSPTEKYLNKEDKKAVLSAYVRTIFLWDKNEYFAINFLRAITIGIVRAAFIPIRFAFNIVKLVTEFIPNTLSSLFKHLFYFGHRYGWPNDENGNTLKTSAGKRILGGLAMFVGGLGYGVFKLWHVVGRAVTSPADSVRAAQVTGAQLGEGEGKDDEDGNTKDWLGTAFKWVAGGISLAISTASWVAIGHFLSPIIATKVAPIIPKIGSWLKAAAKFVTDAPILQLAAGVGTYLAAKTGLSYLHRTVKTSVKGLHKAYIAEKNAKNTYRNEIATTYNKITKSLDESGTIDNRAVATVAKEQAAELENDINAGYQASQTAAGSHSRIYHENDNITIHDDTNNFGK